MFRVAKERCLTAVDLSRKGNVDRAIEDLVKFINQQDDFFTTSSCSGRICVFEQGLDVKKRGCVWLLTSHDQVSSAQVLEALRDAEEDAVFKFEAFVLHTQCRNIHNAQKMHASAVASGFRNSGITMGRKGKIIVAVRSTHGLEIPLTDGGKLMVSKEYIKYIVKLANEKMQENLNRIQRFFENFKSVIEDSKDSISTESKKKHSKKKVCNEYCKEDLKLKMNESIQKDNHISTSPDEDIGGSYEFLSSMYDET